MTQRLLELPIVSFVLRRLTPVFLSIRNHRSQTSWIFRLVLQWWNTSFPSTSNKGPHTCPVYLWDTCPVYLWDLWSGWPKVPLHVQDSQYVSLCDLFSPSPFFSQVLPRLTMYTVLYYSYSNVWQSSNLSSDSPILHRTHKPTDLPEQGVWCSSIDTRGGRREKENTMEVFKSIPFSFRSCLEVTLIYPPDSFKKHILRDSE